MAIKIHAGEITLKRQKVHCHRCGDSLIIELEPGTPAPRKYCTACKVKTEIERVELLTVDEARHAARKVDETERQVKWEKVYLPGDPGFAERAAQVIPIGAITNVAFLPKKSINLGY